MKSGDVGKLVQKQELGYSPVQIYQSRKPLTPDERLKEIRAEIELRKEIEKMIEDEEQRKKERKVREQVNVDELLDSLDF